MRRQDADRLLISNGANRSYTACFVNPNARCPVCGAAVFYYENLSGSRVFFDCLGPPWSKHPCTDAPRLSNAGRPYLRKRGLRIELVEAASISGNYQGSRWNPSGFPIDWQLVEVVSVRRSGWEIYASGRLVEMAEEPLVYFSITSPDDVLIQNDVISACFAAISLIHPTKLTPRNYKVRWYRDDSFEALIETGEHELHPIITGGPGPDYSDSELSSTLIRRSDLRRRRKPISTPAKTSGMPNRKKAKAVSADPKKKGQSQLKREAMLAKVVVEHKKPKSRTRSSRDET